MHRGLAEKAKQEIGRNQTKLEQMCNYPVGLFD